MTIEDAPVIELTAGGIWRPVNRLPECWHCGADELWCDPGSGAIHCYLCSGQVPKRIRDMH